MSEDFSYLCRLCLRTSEFKFSIFTGNILEKIHSLTTIKIQEDDKLPTTCCETCVANVYTSYKFQQCIIESDKTLREKLCHNESNIIELAKQTPDLFEVLQTEGACDSPYTDIIEQLEPKLEIIDIDDCEYKVEEEEVVLDEMNESSNTTDNSNLKSFLEMEEEEKANSEELFIECDMNNSINNLLTCSKDAVDILCDDNIKEQQDEQLAVYLNEFKDTGSNVNLYSNKNTHNSCKENKEDNNHETQDIFTKLGIQSKFVQKFAAYREKQKIMKATLECTDCDKKFDSKRLFHRHMMKHKIDKCPFCSITMRTDNLKRHIQIHTDSPEICEICGSIAKNKESLRGHINYHHKNPQKIKCETCNREFKSNNHYKTHVKKIHLGIKNRQCHICGKKFFANHDLNKHINMTHRGARPYICQYCKKGFSSPYARKTHIRQHTLETPYRCDFCSTGFRQKVSLVTHLKSKHGTVDYDRMKSQDDV